MGANLCDKRKICFATLHPRERMRGGEKGLMLELPVQMLHDRRPIRESDLERGGEENKNGWGSGAQL